jgi:phytoene dehydrogenase-like protein
MKQFPPVGKLTAHGYWLHKRIKDAGGRLILGAQVSGIEDGATRYSQGGTEYVESAAMIVTAMGAKSDNSLEDVLNDLAIPYRTVGDAKSPRRIMEAIHEGHRAGEEI